MSRFINTKNGRIVKVIGGYEKSGTIQVQYEDDGSTTDYSPSTWKRWWRPLTEEKEVASPVQEVEETVEVEEKVAGDGTSYNQVMEEILQDEKKAIEKAKKTKEVKPKATKVDTSEITDYIARQALTINAEGYTRDKQPNYINYKTPETKVLFTVHPVGSHVDLYVKAPQVPSELLERFEVLNGFFNRRLVITSLDKDTKLLIDNIIKALEPKKEEK